MVAKPACGQLNSRENSFFPRSCLRLRIWSLVIYSPVLFLHTQAESGAYS